MALLAAYAARKQHESLEAFLAEQVFPSAESVTMKPEEADVAGFNAYLSAFKSGLAAQRAAVETM